MTENKMKRLEEIECLLGSFKKWHDLHGDTHETVVPDMTFLTTELRTAWAQLAIAKDALLSAEMANSEAINGIIRGFNNESEVRTAQKFIREALEKIEKQL